MAETANILGPARNRIDGRAKVTGAAKYSVEFDAPKCAYGWTVESNIAKGKILSIDTNAAQDAPGCTRPRSATMVRRTGWATVTVGAGGGPACCWPCPQLAMASASGRTARRAARRRE